MNGCVIGNGPSRLEFDLHVIKSGMTTYGCNALHRDFIPDYLIAMDMPMVKEILESDTHLKTKFYTQHENQIDVLAMTEPINFTKNRRETLDSGNTALQIALDNGHETVYMIGFDYELSPSVLPNVYQGTQNYSRYNIYPAASMTATKWLQRLKRMCKEHPDQKIVRVNNRHLEISEPNYQEITSEQFKEIYGIHLQTV